MPRNLLIAIALFIHSPVFGQGSPITDAYRQLRLLSSSTRTGINYRDFNSELRKSIGLVDIAIEDSKPSKLTERLKDIKQTYEDAALLWSCQFQVKEVNSALEYCLTKGFKERNPEIIEVLVKKPRAYLRYVSDPSIGLLFNTASEQIKDLGNLLKVNR